MRISDWSSDVCSSDLRTRLNEREEGRTYANLRLRASGDTPEPQRAVARAMLSHGKVRARRWRVSILRSEEHTSELQSLMRISYAVFCLKKKKDQQNNPYVYKIQKH